MTELLALAVLHVAAAGGVLYLTWRMRRAERDSAAGWERVVELERGRESDWEAWQDEMRRWREDLEPATLPVRSWLDEMVREERVLHLKSGKSIRGYVQEVLPDAVVLQPAWWLGEGSMTPVPRSTLPVDNIDWVQELPARDEPVESAAEVVGS